MEKILKILNKKYDTKLEKQPECKKTKNDLQVLLKEYKLLMDTKDEFSYFQHEIMFHSLLNKQKFEEVFLRTYVSMYDYWKDLDYKERRHQVNVDIDLMKRELIHFTFEDEDIYIPIFDKKMNHMYNEEMVLFELKQYKRFTKEFNDCVKDNLYGSEVYKSDFCSCEFIMENEKGFCVFARNINRIYFVENFKCVDTMSFDPSLAEKFDLGVLKMIAGFYYAQDAMNLIEFLNEHQLVNEKMGKKLEKYRKKLQKKG